MCFAAVFCFAFSKYVSTKDIERNNTSNNTDKKKKRKEKVKGRGKNIYERKKESIE